MKNTTRLGIWIDYSKAHLIEFTIDPIETNIIASEFNHEINVQNLKEGEKLMHNVKQQLQSVFYKKLENIIKNYKDVLLFGPSDAKEELFNVIRANYEFAKIKIEVIQSDKVTENDQRNFVREYFLKHKYQLCRTTS